MSRRPFPKWSLLLWPTLPLSVLFVLNTAQVRSDESDGMLSVMIFLLPALVITIFAIVTRKLLAAASMLGAAPEHRRIGNYLAVGVGVIYVLVVLLASVWLAWRLAFS